NPRNQPRCRRNQTEDSHEENSHSHDRSRVLHTACRRGAGARGQCQRLEVDRRTAGAASGSTNCGGSGRSQQGGALRHTAETPGRLQDPRTYRPNDEHVTIISGTFHFGIGTKLDLTKGRMLEAGGFAHAAKGMQHYAWTTEEAIVQITGKVPWTSLTSI